MSLKPMLLLGLGIGLVAGTIQRRTRGKEFNPPRYAASFDANTVWLGLKRGQLQRNYVWRFLELCNAGLSVEDIKRRDGKQ